MNVEDKVISIIKDKKDSLDKDLTINSRTFAEGMLTTEKPESFKDCLKFSQRFVDSVKNIETTKAKIAVLSELEMEITQEFKNSTLNSLINA